MNEENSRLEYVIHRVAPDYKNISVLLRSKRSYESAQRFLLEYCNCVWSDGDLEIQPYPDTPTYLHIDSSGLLLMTKWSHRHDPRVKAYMNGRGMGKATDLLRAISKLQHEISLYKTVDEIFVMDRATAMKEKGFILRRPKM